MRFVVKRLGLFVVALFGLSLLVFVLLRMLHLRKPGSSPPATGNGEAPAVRDELAEMAPAPPAGEAEAGTSSDWESVPAGLADEVLRSGLEQEMAQLREEVDAIRGELAALRSDMHQELASLRASQTVSPIYGDAMQLAVSGYDAAAIAERCGIARAEADLVVALAKSQEH